MTPEGNDTARTPEDELLARLYQQGTDRQAARYAATYDARAGLTRFSAWLNEHTAAAPVIAAIKADAEAIPVPARPAAPTQTPTARDVITPDAFAPSATADMGWSADRAVLELYAAHYLSLVRLAALLVRDTPTAEEVVQDSFVALHGGWQLLRDADKALAYLRQAVMNRCRSVLRHRAVVGPSLQMGPPNRPGAAHDALVALERDSFRATLRDLPDRQREAIVLRYYADMSEEEIAAAMGISRGAVKSHTTRGMSALRAALERATSQPADPRDGGDAGSGREPYAP
jgi:RNA polymerase sigma-70 factor (sigma-E family)